MIHFFSVGKFVYYNIIQDFFREQKTRWGSCTSEGNLNFNWRLIFAPEKVLDYVVVHELSHRKEMNHSPAFYAVRDFVDAEEAVKTGTLGDVLSVELLIVKYSSARAVRA